MKQLNTLNSLNHSTNLLVVHNIYDLKSGFSHSITVAGKGEGAKVGYKEIARNGVYAASTAHHSELPEVFTVTQEIAETNRLKEV